MLSQRRRQKRHTRTEERESARQARERSTDQEENVLDESSSGDDEEQRPGAVREFPSHRSEASTERFLDEGSNFDDVDDTNAPEMFVVEQADLAPELMIADEVHIQEEEDMILMKKQYRRILCFVMVVYGVAIIFHLCGFALFFRYPPMARGGPWYGFNSLGYLPDLIVACALFLGAIIMYLPMRRCSSIALEDYAPGDKRLLRDAQRVSTVSMCLGSFVAFPILWFLPKLEWLGYALMTCVLAGTVFALLRVIHLLQSEERRQEKSKVFWVSFAALFISLCGATVWRCLSPIYPDCYVEYPYWIGDGDCYGGEYNTEACGYEGGDCLAFVEKYPGCHVDSPSSLGDGWCTGGPYMTVECGYDGGDCLAFVDKYPGCIVDEVIRIGDGVCDGGAYNTEACGYDGGDCLALVRKYPDCHVEKPWKLGNRYCHGGVYNTSACGYDGGDCVELNYENGTYYPDCHVEHPSWIGDGYCDGGLYMTVGCAYDGGDCLAFMGKYPDCHVDQPNRIGDGTCDGWSYMTVECAYDGGDCLAFIDKYPDCHVEMPSKIGDGYCDGGLHMTVECAYDGGDCLAFMDRYPGCIVESPSLIGDGQCHSEPYNTKACDYDGGDCDARNNGEFPRCRFIGDGVCHDAKYPGCHVENPSRIGDGTCDGRLYGTAECGFDGGDCLEAGKPCRGHRECASEICNDVTKVCDSGFVFEQYPNCRVAMPQWIGDGDCDGGYYASEACGFDGGDCLQLGEPCLQDDECASGFCNNSTKVCYLGILQDYPDCVVEYPKKIGDGTCNFGEYLTEACGYDGGDCHYL